MKPETEGRAPTLEEIHQAMWDIYQAAEDEITEHNARVRARAREKIAHERSDQSP